MSDYKVSVIMPALNEENNIVGAIKNVSDSFMRIGIFGEIIVVNDGSTDRTGEIVKGLIEECPFIKLINHPMPKGIGISFWDGVRESIGEIVTMLPGDAENDAFEILRYTPLMEHVDIIVPFVCNREVRPLKRRIISKIYKAIINLSFGMLLNYMNGTVMYRKSILDSIKMESRGFFYQTELLIKCLKKGYLYAEVPYGLKKRKAGRSKALTLRSLKEVIQGYLTMIAAVYLFNSRDKYISSNSVTFLRKRELEAV